MYVFSVIPIGYQQMMHSCPPRYQVVALHPCIEKFLRGHALALEDDVARKKTTSFGATSGSVSVAY